ncbi:membrane protein [Microlunatus endophyticus]|jgi:uncharacterized membrane protein YeaQ/YmgE (transglycosylase-associated protein family)|uniref:Membrane protein n=1 Tax=Microlunatus endophyticus TaxID=1716077 RepID=A0A917SF07_9ACTN|nr:GlsB/YeaQ/YmgE family stress response membrane protein [Microlunatus endophyticus]GGL77965.1 membrane protein [Microlunatus endophyticus]
MSILGTIIAGLVVGVLARVVLPGRQAYGWIVTILLGIAGALIGYWLADQLGVAQTRGIDWIRWILSVAVAAVLSVIFSAITKRRKAA